MKVSPATIKRTKLRKGQSSFTRQIELLCCYGYKFDFKDNLHRAGIVEVVNGFSENDV